MFFIGPAMISWLRQKRWRKDVKSDAEAWQVREDTPETHQKKQGTPSMGGIGIIGVACLLLFSLCVVHLWLMRKVKGGFFLPDYLVVFMLPAIVASHAILGFADDWSKASGRGGLRARAKLIGQLVLSASFLVGLSTLNEFFKTQWPSPELILNLPSLSTEPIQLILGIGVLSLLLVLLIGTCNAVNLTDGIDGLAAGLAVQCGAAFFLIREASPLFGAPAISFWAALAGSCLGFLAYNKHKAQVFMGDTGSLALGAALGAAAIMTHSVFLLPFIGFIYFVEAGSVTLQVLWFKYTKKKYGEGRRIFRRAPLHHHFELGGWSEWRVVLTFWAVNFVVACIGLILWHLKILPRFP
jgi:phospho-N-acetylmuramoyl-pentapeptide-transferase